MVEVTSGSAARQVALLAVVFGAALILILGLASVVGRQAAVATGSPGPSSVAAVGSIAADPSGAPPSGAGSPGGSAPLASGPLPSGSSPRPSGPGPSPLGSPGAGPSASTLPGPTEDVTLVGAGDIADCDEPGDEATANLVEKLPGSVFTAGDDAYPSGTLKEFQDCYAPTWGRFLDRTILPSPGNHDWETPDLAGYLGYFGTRAQPNGTSWYSMDLGAWHVVVLDSECGKVKGCDADSAQGRWLRDDLATATAKCTLAIWHRPRWSSGLHGDDRRVAPFWDLLYAAGADLIVNGHDHDYERFAPRAPNGAEDRVRGLREFVVGTGGAELRGLTHDSAHSELAVGNIAGVIELTLKPGSYAWTFHSVTGELTDQGAARCH